VKDAGGNEFKAKWHQQATHYRIRLKSHTHAIYPKDRDAPFLLPGTYTCNKGATWTVGDSLAE
jgi:hypothetical protein